MVLSSWRREVPFGKYLQPIHLTIVGPSVKGAKAAATTAGAAPSLDKSAPAAAAAGAAPSTEQDGGAILDTNGSEDPVATPAPLSDSAAITDTSSTDAATATSSSPPAPTVVDEDATPEVLSTPKRLKRRQKPAPSPSLSPSSPIDNAANGLHTEDVVLVIPPFESERIPTNSTVGDCMALNAGGPVWALDWLPQDTTRRRKRKPATAKKNNTSTSAAVTNGGSSTPHSDKENRAESENEAGSDSERDEEDNNAVINRNKWRFLALATHPPCEVVDGELVKKTSPDHYYNADDQGARSLVQIWAVPVPPKPKKASGKPTFVAAPVASVQKPKLVFGIDHSSGVAWDLQWCPIVHDMPRRVRSKNLLGVLAICFGDGSLQVFEVPEIAASELLTPQGLSKHETKVEKLRPTVHVKVPRIIQLSVQWSPHRWNLLLTGGSDGSVSLWNLEWELSKPEDPIENGNDSSSAAAAPPPLMMEPQRRFQDVDTVGKQEAFDWGWGWVAVRSVAWSPFDEFIFATTGNDSVFKVWDIREPRICFRSQRIRSTWGLALQWMDHTTVQISGDQGSIYMYDILSGSYQKLHYHPQIDSPVWDLQFARRGGDAPLLVSCCTSGSVRVAPAKKLFRTAQHSIEFCRVSGEKDASVDRPFKALSVDFERKVVSGSAESASPATRQFCERDAALHRLRMSSSATGAFPCFLATGGHAGLVVIMEIQDALDHFLENYFASANRCKGRPRSKDVGPWSASKKRKTRKKQQLASGTGGKKVKAVAKKRQLVKSKKMHNALTKYSKGQKKTGKKATEFEFPQFDMKSASEDNDEEEEEYAEDEEEDDEDSDAGLELMLAEEHSDDDRASYSDVDEDDEDQQPQTQFNPESARMMAEYQLDLSEEDAIMLAIQMSELEQVQSSPPPAKNAKAKAKAPVSASSVTVAVGSQAESSENGAAGVLDTAQGERNVGGKKPPASVTKPPSTQMKQPPATNGKPQSTQKKPQQQKKKTEAGPSDSSATTNLKAKAAGAKATQPSKAAQKKKAQASTITPATTAVAKPSTAKKAPVNKPGGSSKASGAAPAMLNGYEGYLMDQATTWQIIQFQKGMTEEDALIEAIRMSEVEAQRSAEAPQKHTQAVVEEEMTPSGDGGEEASAVAVESSEGEPATISSASAEQKPVAEATEVVTDSIEPHVEVASVVEDQPTSTLTMSISAEVFGSETQMTAVPSVLVAEHTTATESVASVMEEKIPAPIVAVSKAKATKPKPKPKPVAAGKKKAATVKKNPTAPPSVAPASTSTSAQPASEAAVSVSAEASKPKAAAKKKAAAVKKTPSAPATTTAAAPPVVVPESEGLVDAATASAIGDTTTESSAPAVSVATPTEPPAEASSVAAPKSRAKAKASSSTSTVKRKRAPPKTSPQPRKRPAKAGNTSSRARGTRAAGAGQEGSGYLTDEEALYLALRASEVEY